MTLLNCTPVPGGASVINNHDRLKSGESGQPTTFLSGTVNTTLVPDPGAASMSQRP